MTAQDLRRKYIEFFESKDHTEIAGKSLIPENDATVLFTTAGMHPLVPYILGEPHPAGKRLTNYQKCIRTGDIEDVGDPTHLTFFEMLGNWSLGDYFKKEAIEYSFEFLTSPQWLGLSPESLHITVFEGDDEVPRDDESAGIWYSVGIPRNRLYFMPREDNWWGPAGKTGPCGPDSEMFVDTGKGPCSEQCKPGCPCGKYFEIWNDVFMQYNKKENGTYEPLKNKTVDTGMGLERTTAMLQGKASVYETELLAPVIESIEKRSGLIYGRDDALDVSFRIITDHLRSACFILGDENGIKPSNIGQGYIIRRLVRRAIRHGRKLSLDGSFLGDLADSVVTLYREAYPGLERSRKTIVDELSLEEQRFGQTLRKGEHEFEKLLPNLMRNPNKVMPGRLAFRLYDTYGFPLELTEELAGEHGLSVDLEGFNKAFEKHQALSKAGSEKTFKGGLADHSEMVTRLHTATHLLHQALRMVLGKHVEQKGSNISPERLRFDFSHPQKLTAEELSKVEEIVNQQIQRGLDVSFDVMTIEQAIEGGAIALFSEKYEEKVKVYAIGDFSKEVCGGPHVGNIGALGKLRIAKEQSSSAGVRRIRAVLESE